MRRATLRLDSLPRSVPSSRTHPRRGFSTPASSDTSVVLPPPLGPSSAVSDRFGIVRVMSRSSNAGSPRRPYPNETLSACSNAYSGHEDAAWSREAERFFVRAIGGVLDAREELKEARHAIRTAQIEYREAIGVEDAARGAKRRLDVADRPAHL